AGKPNIVPQDDWPIPQRYVLEFLETVHCGRNVPDRREVPCGLLLKSGGDPHDVTRIDLGRVRHECNLTHKHGTSSSERTKSRAPCEAAGPLPKLCLSIESEPGDARANRRGIQVPGCERECYGAGVSRVSPASSRLLRSFSIGSLGGPTLPCSNFAEQSY